MSSSGYLALGAGGLFGSLLIWALARDRRRVAAKRERFVGRQPLDSGEIYRTYYQSSGLEKESVRYYWDAVARLLALDARRLRPGDRFDEELAPVAGKELGDEIEDLGEFLELESREKSIEFEPSELNTLDDLIRVFGAKR